MGHEPLNLFCFTANWNNRAFRGRIVPGSRANRNLSSNADSVDRGPEVFFGEM
jgi:hypothetical protein